MPGDGLSSSISTFLRKTDHFTEEYKHSVREREMSTNREISSIDKVTKDNSDTLMTPTGCFFKTGAPLTFLSTNKSFYNLWHLERFRASLHGFW